MPDESLEDDDDPMMEEASYDEPAPALANVDGFTMVQAHFNTIMAEVEQEKKSAPPMLGFEMLQEEQRHNLDLLVHHRLAEWQIADK